MPTLLEKIEANAASRLQLAEGEDPGRQLERYRTFLKVEWHRLKMLHRAGRGGRDICRAHAAVLDLLFRILLESLIKQNTASPATTTPLALVAIGGYGRGELNPQSDVDIMFLHDGSAAARKHPGLSLLTNGLLWDIGLKVGHAVRSIADCVQVANSDMRSKTSLIEARLIAGDAGLFDQFQKTLLAKCVQGHETAYISARIEDQDARHAKFGNTACMQEPNIKNGCGGLRDYQNLLWMAFFKYRTRTTRELQQREMVSSSEAKQLEAAYDFLLRVRNDLHYLVKRPVDVLTKNLQPTVAHHLGYTSRSPSQRLEAFMRDLYTHTRNIYLITRTVEQRLALLPQPSRVPSLRRIIRNRLVQARQQFLDGFKISEGEIHAASARVFKDQPRRLMRVFLHAQQRDLKLHPELAQMIRNDLPLMNREFLHDEHVRETFLEILDQPGNVAPLLRSMHEVGLLGKYLPEFGKLTCLVQHEFYHLYTADEHTLICLEKLDRVWDAKDPPYSHYAEFFQKLERPFVLYLALLLHDSGKALHTGNHCEVGGQLAERVARRLALDAEATEGLKFLIEQHLLMAKLSQRRDLDDPAVIRHFASQVQTPENLIRLTLHTFADSQGTSEDFWNDFKDMLLRTLLHKTLDLLSGASEMQRAEAKQRELLEQEVARIMPRTFSKEELQAHFENLPARYALIHDAHEIVVDLSLVHRFLHHQISEEDEQKALEPVCLWHNEPDRGYTSLKICTWDRAGFFSLIAGSLSAAGLNILSAQIFTRADGIVIDTFYVTDARSGSLVRPEERDHFESCLLKSLTGNPPKFRTLIARQQIDTPPSPYLVEERIPTTIFFDNDASETRTVLEIETEDRFGLLYVISEALNDAGLDIYVAKIATEKGAAFDTFYVCERTEGHEESECKVTSPERLREIEERLRNALADWGEFAVAP